MNDDKVKQNIKQDIKQQELFDVLVKVNSRTRAGKNGRECICPYCNTLCKFYSFSFSAFTCQGCKVMVEKNEYLTKAITKK